MCVVSSKHLLFNLRDVDRDVAHLGQAAQQHDGAADAHRRRVTSRTACAASTEAQGASSACVENKLAQMDRPAGASEASVSDRYCLGLPQASASHGQSAASAALPGRVRPVLSIEWRRRCRRPRAFAGAVASKPWVAACSWAPTASAAAPSLPKRPARRRPERRGRTSSLP